MLLKKKNSISDHKVKTLQFKNDSLIKDVSLYKRNCDEMENTIEILEKKWSSLEDQIRNLTIQINSQSNIQNDRMFQNPNLNLTRIPNL